jgi:glycosyltransferase involved in cell wall biosynthesis
MARWLAPAPEGHVEPGEVPTFSVIIPAYQMAHLVGEAVTSALEQTATPHEVIVCDDGSTDDTHDVLRAFGDRIRVVTQPNRGVAAAKNAAAGIATGDFVAVLDADDVYLPTRLERMGELAAARPDLDVLNTDVHFEKGGELLSRLTDHVPFPVDDQRGGILQRCFMHSCAAVRRQRLRDVGGFDASVDFADDWDCWLRLIFSGARVGLVDEPLALYRLHEDAMSANRARDLAGMTRVLERALDNQPLTASEREIATGRLRHAREQYLRASAEEALVARRPHTRRALLRLATGRGIGARSRAKALAAAVAPEAARRSLERRDQRGRRSHLVRPLPTSDRRR